MKTIFAIFIFFTLSMSVNAKPMTMVDLLNVPAVQDAQLSPDGKTIVFVKSSANWEENINITSIWRVNANGGSIQQISSDITSTNAPRWSPDGTHILFLSKRNDDKNTQIYTLTMTGGEAIRLTDHDTSISSAEWSQNGEEIFFLASDPIDKDQKELEEEKNDIYKFENNYQQNHLWKVSLKDNLSKRITEGDFSITDYQLSRDGQKIIHHRAPNPLLDATLDNEVWIMSVDGSNALQITQNTNPEDKAELSPDNKSVLYLSWVNENDDPYYENNLFIVPANGGTPKQLLGTFDHDIEQAHWSKDGKSIYFKANLGVHSELFKYNYNSGDIAQLTQGDHTIANWYYSYKQDSHILSIRTADNNGDFWQIKDNRDPQKITKIFDYIKEDFDIPRQETVKWKGADGIEIEGMLTYPNNYKKDTRYPLVVQTHGGPRSSDKWGGFFSTTSYAPVLAAHGYFILHPNYRGSLGYGDNFVRDMVGGYFNNSHLDVMAGVDHLIDLGIVDETKMVKMGYSAGGHMTNKLITFTDRFKVASSAAGTANWISMYSQSDTRIYRTPWFNGTPWQKNAPIDTYWNHSPLKDIANVKTPTMIIVGGADVRVPKEQSIELYRALKSNGVETELYIAPREQHIWKELRHKLSKMNVEMSWFEKHIRASDFIWEKPPEKRPPLSKVIVIK